MNIKDFKKWCLITGITLFMGILFLVSGMISPIITDHSWIGSISSNGGLFNVATNQQLYLAHFSGNLDALITISVIGFILLLVFCMEIIYLIYNLYIKPYITQF